MKHFLSFNRQRDNLPLREKCPDTEFFLVRIFPHSDWIRRDTPCLFVFSPNARKYGPEKTPCLGTFHAVIINILFLNMLGADDSDLSCSLVQVIALFGHNEYPKHGIGTEVHLLWLFSLLSSQARFDGRPDLLIMTDLLAWIKAFSKALENFNRKNICRFGFSYWTKLRR